jgi:hypothetical protein
MVEARERLGAAYEPEHRAGAGLTLEQAVAEATGAAGLEPATNGFGDR